MSFLSFRLYTCTCVVRTGQTSMKFDIAGLRKSVAKFHYCLKSCTLHEDLKRFYCCRKLSIFFPEIKRPFTYHSGQLLFWGFRDRTLIRRSISLTENFVDFPSPSEKLLAPNLKMVCVQNIFQSPCQVSDAIAVTFRAV